VSVADASSHHSSARSEHEQHGAQRKARDELQSKTVARAALRFGALGEGVDEDEAEDPADQSGRRPSGPTGGRSAFSR
jgi:hypothetical protein